VVVVPKVGAYVAEYIKWFQSVSYPYIIQMPKDDCPVDDN